MPPAVPHQHTSALGQPADQDPAASSKCQLCRSPHPGYRAACQIVKQIFEVLLKIFHAVALRVIIGKFLKVPEPVIAILPINVASGHALSVKQSGLVSLGPSWAFYRQLG